jgi:2-desacetyl-2-hydroxyethyl bacteriochlorophyllide A dehydrogenase
MKSRYIVFPDREQVAIREEDLAPPGEGEILCQAEKSLISTGTELHCLRGVFEEGTNWHDWVKFPFRPGYSMVGRVVAVGRGVGEVKEGDLIASYDAHQQYYKITPERRNTAPQGAALYRIPDGISSEDGTWRSLAMTCQNAVRRANFQFGETACVVGLGLLGQLVTQYLSTAGARRIIVIDPVAGRLELARQHGATHVLQVDVSTAQAPIQDITGGWLCDVVFDVTGHPATLAPCIRLVRRMGRLVLLGDTPTPSQQHLGPGVVSNSISILGTHGYVVPHQTTVFAPWTIEAMSDVFFDYLAQGKMKVDDLVTHRYSPLDAVGVYSALVKDRSSAMGVIFDWTQLQG